MKWMKVLLFCFLPLLLLSCASMRSNQELQLGKANFESGFFRESFRQLLPLAYNGNAEAQYGVGYMYYYGYGVAQDTETGTFWIKKSADQGFPKAIEALHTMKNPNVPSAY